ncbi:mucin-5AC-like isoform X2 [Bolinopsis microptera]|uniref:mucin-5AC-like isoform X2 n=1 Tax=Bolinopsis microptera TaxID=2820187 RepID=UPI003078DB86
MTNKRGTTQSSPNFRNSTNNRTADSETVPNSVARRRSQMGSSFSSSRRNTLSNAATSREQEPGSSAGGVSNVYSTRYSRRSLNQPQRVASVTRYNRLGRRHTTTASSSTSAVRESPDQTPGPRRSARISSRLIERRLSTTIPSPLLSNTISNPSEPVSPASEELTPTGMPSVTSSPFSLPSRPVSGRVSSASRPSSAAYNSDSMEEGWQWREFTNSPVVDWRSEHGTPLPPIPHSTTPPTATTTPPPATHPTSVQPEPNTDHQAATNDTPDTDIQSVEIVRVVPHRLIEIPESEPFEPRPPPRYRPSSGRSSLGSGVLRRARRLLRESTSSSTPEPEPSTSIANPPPESDSSGEVTPTQPRRQFREIRFSHSSSSASASAAALRSTEEEHPTASTSSPDDALRGRLFERAEHEALNNMIMSTSVTANERLQRLRLLRLSRTEQSTDVTARERIITGLLRRRETAESSGESSGENSGVGGESSSTSGPTRLRMFEVPGQGAILMEDIRPETSLRMSLVQAQYLQEVLLRISSLLDNLHILSQMNERIEDDPRLRTILAFATLDPDNMTYEQLLMLDELLPKNQGATKEMISNKTSLQQYHKSDNHENDSCIICITDFEESEGIRLLPCCHIYHFGCVDNWLKRKKTCPMCRSPIDDKPTKMYLERMDRYRDFKK